MPKPRSSRKPRIAPSSKKAMERIGIAVPKSGVARNLIEAQSIREEVGLPCVLRPSFTLGGSGGGIAYNREEFNELIAHGLELSPMHEVLIEESVIGWKEFELEVMRDCADNVVIVCTIENFLIQWACTLAIPSPLPRPRRSPTRNISGCAMPPWPSSAKSESKRGAAISSSPSIPTPARW